MLLDGFRERGNQFRAQRAFGQLLKSNPDHRGERLCTQQLPGSRGFRRMLEQGGEHRIERGGDDGLSSGRDALGQRVEKFL